MRDRYDNAVKDAKAGNLNDACNNPVVRRFLSVEKSFLFVNDARFTPKPEFLDLLQYWNNGGIFNSRLAYVQGIVPRCCS